MKGTHYGIFPRLRARLLAGNSYAYDTLFESRKRQLFADLQGTIMEIGPGTGANLRYLPMGVTWIGVEPNRFMHRYLRDSMKTFGVKGRIIEGRAEALPVAAGSVDVVVSTLVLCSVCDLAGSLREIKRVLKPNGQFLFIEHVAASGGTWLYRVQRLVRPVWRLLGGGCQPDLDILRFIENAAFGRVNIESFTLGQASSLTPHHIIGRVVNAGQVEDRFSVQSVSPDTKVA